MCVGVFWEKHLPNPWPEVVNLIPSPMQTQSLFPVNHVEFGQSPFEILGPSIFMVNR